MSTECDRNVESRLWALTCLFNPAGYRVRATNFRKFRSTLKVPLLAIELAFGDLPYELNEGDAEILISLRGGDLMWQKERLLNIGLAKLPSYCTEVLWIDADMIVPEPRWPSQISEALQRHPVVQPYSVVCHLDSDGTQISWNQSAISAFIANQLPDNWLRTAVGRSMGCYSPGHMWAARRELLENHGFYDACIVGGGDSAFTSAALGQFDQLVEQHCMGLSQSLRYLDWAQQLYAQIRGSIGVVDTRAYHLWHGTLVDRRGRARHEGLAAIGFDPFHDIAKGRTGAWCWATDRPELHLFVNEYFLGRREDPNESSGLPLSSSLVT